MNEYFTSHTVPITEKANSHDRVTVDGEISNINDIQGSEENGSHEQRSTAKTNNSVF
jgi:hypothetical protein